MQVSLVDTEAMTKTGEVQMEVEKNWKVSFI